MLLPTTGLILRFWRIQFSWPNVLSFRVQRYSISVNGANKFSKTLIFNLADGRQQVVYGHSTYGEGVIFDPPHGRFWRCAELFVARVWVVASSSRFSRLPRGDLTRRVEPRTAIVDTAAIAVARPFACLVARPRLDTEAAAS